MSLNILAGATEGANKLDFMIHGLYEYELFGQKLSLTTTTVSVLIVVLLICNYS